MIIRDVDDSCLEALADIYNHYITHSLATFEEVVLTADDFRSRSANVASQGLPWLVAEDGGRIVGYAYANRWRERSAYRYSVEVTVYIAHDCTGGGYGTKLYRALFERLRDTPVHAAIGGITLPNDASVALHEKMGMVKVAEFPEVGYKQGQWLDVGYWQIIF